MSSSLGRSVCAKSNFFVVGSLPAAEASFFVVDRSVAAAANFLVVATGAGFFVVDGVVATEGDFVAVDRVVAAEADFFADRVVAAEADFFADRVVAAEVDFFVVDGVDLVPAVSSLISFLTSSGFFRSAVPFTPRFCSLRRSSPTFIAAIALSLTPGVLGVSLPLVRFLALLVAAMPIHLTFHRCFQLDHWHYPAIPPVTRERRTWKRASAAAREERGNVEAAGAREPRCRRRGGE
jgi:hypothetical protein